jgi:hypothetical protein
MLGLVTTLLSHPAIEGGIKHGFAGVKDGGYTHIELVADPKANELRIFISQAIDEKIDGKNHEWVRTLTVRQEALPTSASGEKSLLLPLPDLGSGKDWFAVSPARTKDGFHFYQIEATARVVLDGNSANVQNLKFEAGKAPNGVHCLRAALDLSKAKTIRLEEVVVKVLDAQKAKPPVVKQCFEKGWGLGALQSNIRKTDYPLSKFSDSIGNIANMEKFRKAQAP